MHELAIAESIIETALDLLKKRNADRITEIGLRIGRLSDVVPDALEFGFDACKRETPLADAKLSIEKIPVTEMKRFESGAIQDIHGGSGIWTRLKVLGIRPGVVVTKRNISFFGYGPVILQVGGSQVSLGYGMGRKVIVEVDR